MGKYVSRSLMGLAVSLVALNTHAAIVFQNLGTTAPPTTLGGISLQPFTVSSQSALTDLSTTTTIPGSPGGGTLTLTNALQKRTVPGSWGSWSHSYTGPVFAGLSAPASTANTLTLPAGATAFSFYLEPNNGTATVTATSDSGTTSGPISVNFSSGATGLGFYATAGETITSISITVSAGAGGYALGEFSISPPPPAPLAGVPTLSQWGMALLSCLLAGLALGKRRYFRPSQNV